MGIGPAIGLVPKDTTRVGRIATLHFSTIGKVGPVSRAPVLNIGARSDIGRAIARKFAALGHPIQLAARNSKQLQLDKTDIELRYRVEVTLHDFDALEVERHVDFVANLPALPDIAICLVGLMGQQAKNEQDLTAAVLVMRSIYEGPAGILSALANQFEARGRGTLVGVSSVAGERGRAAN